MGLNATRAGTVATLVGLTIASVLVAWWAPVVHDGWLHHLWWQDPASHGSEWPLAYYADMYMHHNPRLGQVLTRAAYAPGPLPLLILPALVLATHVLIPTLALGRWPRPSQPEDLALLWMVGALFWIGVPRPGVVLGYAPIATNYLFGALATLALFVPLRFALDRPTSRRWRRILLVAAVPSGVAVGLCNEHTGPIAIVAYLGLALWVARERNWDLEPWIGLSWVSLITGYALLFFAPGQSARYRGTGAQEGVVERVLSRPWDETVDLLGGPLLAQWPLLVALAIALGVARWASRTPTTPLRRHARTAALLWLASAAVVVLTLASPKHGSRLYVAPALVLILATVGPLRLAVRRTWPRRILAGLALVVVVVGWWAMLDTYRTVGAEFVSRQARIDRARPASTLILPRYSIDQTPFFHGEDMDSPKVRRRLAEAYDLERVVLGAEAP